MTDTQLDRLIAATGATYRKLDHWCRRGYLHVPPPGGSGYRRAWPTEEIRVARTMARLTSAGFTPALAERIARGEQEPGPGIRVEVSA